MKFNNETKIGVMVVCVIGALIFMTVKSGNLNFTQEGYSLKVRFSNIDGVNMNSPVMVNGYEVGIVEDIRLIDEEAQTKVELDLWMRGDVVLRDGTKAYVKNLGFMGEKYIGLVASGAMGAALKEGDLLQSVEPQNFEEIVRNGRDISVQVKEISEKINVMLASNGEKIDSILTHINTTVDKLSSISTNIDDRLRTNKENFDEIISNLRGVSTNLEEMSRDLKANPWKIMYRAKEK